MTADTAYILGLLSLEVLEVTTTTTQFRKCVILFAFILPLLVCVRLVKKRTFLKVS